MFSISGDTATGCLVLGESSSLFGRVKSFCPRLLAARLTISCRYTWELPTSAFELELPWFPVARLTLFWLYSFPGLTGGPDPCDRRPVTPIWHQSQRALSLERKNFWNCLNPNMSNNKWCWINTEGYSIHFSRNFLGLGCQQVGFWCQHIWFGIWDPSLILSNNQPGGLCEFLTHISPWDFVL